MSILINIRAQYKNGVEIFPGSRGPEEQIPAVLRQEEGGIEGPPKTGAGGTCGVSAAPHSCPRSCVLGLDSYQLLLLAAVNPGKVPRLGAGSREIEATARWMTP